MDPENNKPGPSAGNTSPHDLAAAGAFLIAILYIFANLAGGAKYGMFLLHLKTGFFHYFGEVRSGELLRAGGFALAALLYFCSLYFTGREISFISKLRPGGILSSIVCNVALGAGFFSLLLLCLGLLHMLDRKIIIAIYAVPFAAAALRLPARKNSADPKIKLRVPPGAISGISAAAALFFLFSVVGFIFCLTPSTAVDSLMYHMAIPDMYLKAGRIFYIPFTVAANLTQGMELHFMAGMALQGATLARLTGFGFLLLAALAVAALSRRGSGMEASCAAAVLFLSVPITCSNFYLDNVEPALAFFEIAAMILFMEWQKRGGGKLLFFTGLLCGFATAVKLTGILFSIVLLSAASYRIFISKNRGELRKRDLLWFCAAAAAPVLPWLIKSYIWTGNPIWPFFYSVLGGRNWSALTDRDLSFLVENVMGARSLKMFFLALPGLARNSWHENIGAPLVVLLPFLLLKKEHGGKIFSRRMFVISGLLFAIWYIHKPQVHYLLPTIGIVCAAYAPIFDVSRQRGRAVFILAAAFQLLVFTATSLQSVPLALGSRNNKEYSALRDGSTYVYEYMDGALPRDAKILMMGHTKGLYCPRAYFYGDPLGQGYIRYHEYGSNEEIMERLRKEGITHALVSRSGTVRQMEFDRKLRDRLGLSANDVSALSSAIRFQDEMIRSGRWRLLYTSPDNNYSLYKMVYSKYAR